jgi:putative DNA primase/helicase
VLEPDAHDPDSPPVAVRVPLPSETAGLKHTDIGNGKRMAACGETWLRHVHGVGWHIWDLRRWLRDESETYLYQLAKLTVEGIYAERAHFAALAEQAETNEERESWLEQAEAAERHAIRSESAFHVGAMIKMVKSDAKIAVLGRDGRDAAERLDADPHLLNLRNGTLDLSTSTLREHDPGDLITKIANVSYDPTATAPAWAAFLRLVLPDPGVRDYVQRAVGYSLLGSFSEFLFIPYGEGMNGKSTFLRALRDVLGEYSASMPAELLAPRRSGLDAGAYSALANMRGVRLVTTGETEQGRGLSESFVKELTGEGTLQAKFMRHDMFEFQNKTAVWLATNHLPIVKGDDIAIWRRLRLIPFVVTIPPELRKDPSVVEEEFQDERAGILNWMLSGLARYRDDGLSLPTAVQRATDEWRREMDPMTEWLADCCALEPVSETPVKAVRTSYADYCSTTGRFPLGPAKFNERLERLGCERTTARVLGKPTKVWRASASPATPPGPTKIDRRTCAKKPRTPLFDPSA